MSRIIIAFLFATSLCSCGAHGSGRMNHYYPVRNFKMRESSLGFSIQPPRGANWYEKLNNNTLYYLKRLPSNNYSIYTKASEIRLNNNKMLRQESFIQYVKEKKKLDSNGDYRNISFNYAFDPELSPLCVRYTQNYDDHSQKQQLGSAYIRVKNRGLVCMHPRTPGKGIDMYYVEKYLPDNIQAKHSYQEEAEFFLSSLTFSPSGG